MAIRGYSSGLGSPEDASKSLLGVQRLGECLVRCLGPLCPDSLGVGGSYRKSQFNLVCIQGQSLLFGIFIKKVSTCLKGGCQIFQSYIFRLIATHCMLVEAYVYGKEHSWFCFLTI